MVRFKYRYILCDIQLDSNKLYNIDNQHLYDTNITSYNIYNSIKQSISNNYGIYGNGMLSNNIQVKYYNVYTNLCIIRTYRDNIQYIQYCLIYNNKLYNSNKQVYNNVRYNILYISGTIKSVQNYAIQYTRKYLLKILYKHNKDKDNKNDNNQQQQQLLHDTNTLIDVISESIIDNSIADNATVDITQTTNDNNNNKRKLNDTTHDNNNKRNKTDNNDNINNSYVLLQLKQITNDIQAIEP